MMVIVILTSKEDWRGVGVQEGWYTLFLAQDNKLCAMSDGDVYPQSIAGDWNVFTVDAVAQEEPL